jgi:hypothetical protein
LLENKVLEKKMHGIERYKESFKDSITKRFEKQDEEFKSLSDKIKSFEFTQIEYKKRLSHLENKRDTNVNEDFELQHVKNQFCIIF